MADTVETFLRHACLGYNEEDGPARFQVARSLLARDPDIARADIYTAAASGHVAATREFLAGEPALANRKSGPLAWPPLLYLAYSRVNCSLPGFHSLEVARLLLEHGADPNAHYLWGGTYRFTALTGAFGEGEEGPENQPPHQHCLQLAEMLLQAGADPNDGQGLYNRMFTPGHQCLALLLRYGLNADHMINWKTPAPMKTLDFQLLWACRHEYTDRARLLLEHGADPNLIDAKGISVHRHAVRSGCESMADLLAQYGAGADLQPVDHLLAACLRADRAEAERLLATDPGLMAGLTPDDSAALIVAAGRGNHEAVALMLDLGFPIDGREPGGNHATALHHAASSGHLETVRLLVARGASLRLRDSSHASTALGWADHCHKTEVAAFLLDGAIDIFDAVWMGGDQHVRELLAREPEAARALLRHPAEEVFPAGEHAPAWITPLHYAARQGKRAAAEMLLAHGADPEGSPDQEKSPLAVAETHGHEDVAALLREHGATS